MSRIVEFTTSARLIEGEQEGKATLDLKAAHVARIWPENQPKRGKPEIMLIGDDFAALLEQIRMWDAEGRPSMAEAEARASGSANP